MRDRGTGRAFVLTISDRSARGERPDTSGDVLETRLTELGFGVDRAIVPDDEALIAESVQAALGEHVLIVTTGGTGLGPRDVTPQSLLPLLDYVIPGMGEAMRAEGRRSTPNAALSRSFGGVLHRRLVLALPGSPAGARESLDAVAEILPHALSTLAGGGHLEQGHQHGATIGNDVAEHRHDAHDAPRTGGRGEGDGTGTGRGPR